jgi:hypothetical protein
VPWRSKFSVICDGIQAAVVQRRERLAAVASSWAIRRKLLYEWPAGYRTLGTAGLNRFGVAPDRLSMVGRRAVDLAQRSSASSAILRPLGLTAAALPNSAIAFGGFVPLSFP